MLTLKVLSLAVLVGSVAWFIHAPDYEPALASITALSACITTFIVDRKRQNRASLHQEVGDGSVGIQAGGDIRTGNVSTKTTGK